MDHFLEKKILREMKKSHTYHGLTERQSDALSPCQCQKKLEYLEYCIVIFGKLQQLRLSPDVVDQDELPSGEV